MAKYWQRIEKIKQSLGEQHHKLRVSVATVSRNHGIYAYGEKHPVGEVMNDIGLQRPLVQRGNFYYINLSEEKLSDMDGDVLFLLTSPDKRSQDLLEQLQKNPLWQKLNAVQQGRVYPVDYLTWHSLDILAMNAVLDDLEKYLVNIPEEGGVMGSRE